MIQGNRMDKRFFSLIRETEKEPSPDLVKCSDCGKTFKACDCPTSTEGDCETGYYDLPFCPECKDGGCLDTWEYSKIQMKKLMEWQNKYNV